MFDFLLLIFFTVIIGTFVQQRETGRVLIDRPEMSRRYDKGAYLFIILLLSLFAGLRTSYNDTSLYMDVYRLNADASVSLGTLLTPYGGYSFVSGICGKVLGLTANGFLFVYALVFNLLFFGFTRRHSAFFGESLFLFLIGSYKFSMAGMKQAMAIAVSLYAIEAFLQKRRLRAILLLLIAATFHPYIIVMACVPLLCGQAWSRKTMVVMLISFILFMNMEVVFDLFSVIGKDYSFDTIDQYTVNPFRIAIEAIPVVISLIERKAINATGNRYLMLGVNMKVISFLFLSVGLFVNPIYPGRMATYFSCLTAMYVPYMLTVTFKDTKGPVVWKGLYYGIFLLYCILDFTKLGTIGFTVDQFRHVGIGALFH